MDAARPGRPESPFRGYLCEAWCPWECVSVACSYRLVVAVVIGRPHSCGVCCLGKPGHLCGACYLPLRHIYVTVTLAITQPRTLGPLFPGLEGELALLLAVIASCMYLKLDQRKEKDTWALAQCLEGLTGWRAREWALWKRTQEEVSPCWSQLGKACQ